MTHRTETAYARSALYEIRPADITEVDEYNSYRDGETTYGDIWVLDLSNEDGNGLALTGTRRELVNYLDLVAAHVKFETDPSGDLDQALRRLHALRDERATALDAGDDSTLNRLDEEEVALLQDVVAAAEAVNDSL
ncbi:hypothetical protein [Mycobacterium sp. AT1]|uniref:hypothetical protein n=1 Tax=Mycobacterium sp. AT1 TaxID=1961706 RepID=UPI0009AC3B01|nr:hypothetical protein [Mycobacterium sp. AT1]OPX08356.1 hypothetical protein B1790_19885 [Mycobacterium sp. AT1]